MNRARPPGSVLPVTNPRTGEVRYRARAIIDGEYESVGTWGTETEAWDAVAEAQPQRLASSGRTLRAWGKLWLKRREERGLVRSWRKDKSRWKAHIGTAPFADTELRRIDPQDVHRWVQRLLGKQASHGGEDLGRTLARQTVSNALNLLRCALQDACAEGWCKHNAARDVRVPRVPREEDPHTFLTMKDLHALLTCKAPHRASPQARAIFTVAAYTALRPGELWRLRRRDLVLDGERPELAIGKTKSGRPRHVPLLGPSLSALRMWLQANPCIGSALVFPGARGKPHVEGYDAGWASWRKASGINPKARFYDLRHTCASHLLMGSGDGYPTDAWSIERVSAFLGHSDIKVTQRHYARFVPGWLDAPAAAARKEWEAR
jgi:integrase